MVVLVLHQANSPHNNIFYFDYRSIGGLYGIVIESFCVNKKFTPRRLGHLSHLWTSFNPDLPTQHSMPLPTGPNELRRPIGNSCACSGTIFIVDPSPLQRRGSDISDIQNPVVS